MKTKKLNQLETLPRHMELLLLQGAKAVGSFEPEEVLSYVEEQMTSLEAHLATEFLTWVSKNKKTFGHGNIQAVWKEWQRSL